MPRIWQFEALVYVASSIESIWQSMRSRLLVVELEHEVFGEAPEVSFRRLGDEYLKRTPRSVAR
jgi:hypothetical protein